MDHNSTLKLIGRRLREERTRCALSLDAAAGELGVHKSALSRIENGERGLDSIMLRRAAGLYEVPMDALFEEAATELVVKARDLSGDLAGVDDMSRWAQRKLSELQFVREERVRA